MLDQDASSDDFWCPLEDNDASAKIAALELSATEREALTRLARREWIPDAYVDRLEVRGLVERTCGEVRLTPAARASI